MKRTRRRSHYTKPVEYTAAQLETFRLLDLLRDARSSLRMVRELDKGANPRHYGMTREQLIAYAAQQRLTVRIARGKALVS